MFDVSKIRVIDMNYNPLKDFNGVEKGKIT